MDGGEERDRHDRSPRKGDTAEAASTVGQEAILEHYKVTYCRSKFDYTLKQEDFKARS